MEPESAAAQALIRNMIAHKVALTSTLPVFESDASPTRAPRRPEVLDAMSIPTREAYLMRRERPADLPRSGWDWEKLLKREMALERAFVAAGGLLTAGADPTVEGVLPGFADQRGMELLVEAGFTPEQAVRISTLNGAVFLGRDTDIGSIAAGKRADLVVLQGDPSRNITDVRNVTLVFKNGVGFDPQKLLASVRGRYGQY
jgi:hypothetical protein